MSEKLKEILARLKQCNSEMKTITQKQDSKNLFGNLKSEEVQK